MIHITAAGGVAVMVDEEMLEILSNYSWRIDRYEYARTNVKRKTVLMHRMILGLGRGDPRFGDHIDGNPLNNTRTNLRICTRAQSICNRRMVGINKTGFKGVSYLEKINKWQAAIGFQKKSHYLGLFSSPEEAHRAYCEAAAKLHGEFANFGAVAANQRGGD
jgi:hypothetical protein